MVFPVGTVTGRLLVHVFACCGFRQRVTFGSCCRACGPLYRGLMIAFTMKPGIGAVSLSL